MRRTIITFAILITAVSPVFAGTIATQGSTNSTTTTTPPTVPEVAQAIELFPTMRIRSWSSSNGTFSLVVGADVPTRIAITNAGEFSRILSKGDDAAIGKARVRRMILTPGTTVVKFRARSVGDTSAITILLSNVGGTTAIHSDAIKTRNPPVEYGVVRTFLAPTAVAVADGTFLRVHKKCNEEQLEVEQEWRMTE